MWKPRASSLAGYAYCDARAAYDRLAVPDPNAPPRDTRYADLGSLIHLATQRAAGCVFDRTPEDCTEDQIKSAAKLFGDDEVRLRRAVSAAAAAALAALPQTPDGQPWRAEVVAKNRFLTGHIDLLSQDGTVLIDIKTTSRKPDHNRVKGEHFLQMLGYKFLVPTITRAHILYVDSVGAKWTMLSLPMDMGPESEAERMLPRLKQFLRRLKSKSLFDTCIPRPGGHCSGCFCPHTATCKDAFIPPAGPVVDHTPAITPTVTEVFT